MTSELPSEQDAKRIVLEFFDLAFVQGQAAEAAERYLGTEYKQHNPHALTVARPSSASWPASRNSSRR